LPDYYGHRFLAEGSSNYQTYNPRRISYRVRSLDSKTVDKIAVYVAARTGTPPAYTLELQSDDGSPNHLPSGTVLTSGTFAIPSSGWVEVDVTDYAISSGTLYHIVLYCPTSDSSNNAWFPQITPLNDKWVNDLDMPDRDVLRSADGSSWTPQTAEPVWWFRFTDTTRRGNVFTKYETKIYPTGTFRRDGEYIAPVTGGDRTVTKIAFRLRKVGTPPNDVTYTIYNVTDAVTVETGTLCTPGDLTTSFAWIEKALSETRTLVNGKNYRVYVETAGGDTNNCPIVLNTSDLALASAQGPLTYDGTTSVWTYWNGTSWITSADTDAVFRFELAAVVAAKAVIFEMS